MNTPNIELLVQRWLAADDAVRNFRNTFEDLEKIHQRIRYRYAAALAESRRAEAQLLVALRAAGGRFEAPGWSIETSDDPARLRAATAWLILKRPVR